MGRCPEFHQPSKSASYEISGRGDLLKGQLLPTGSSIVLFHLKWDFFPSFMLIFQVNMHGKKDFCTKLLQSAIKFTERFLLFQWSSTQSLHPKTSALFRGSHTAIFSCMPTQPPFQITVALHVPLYPLPNLTITKPFFPCWSIMTVTLLCISQGKVPHPGALRPTSCTWRSPLSSLCFSSVFSKSQFPAPHWHEGLLFVLWPRATTCLLWANICFLQLRYCQWWPHHTSWPSASAMCCPHLIHFLCLGLQIPKSSASSSERQPSFDTPLFLLDLRYIHSAVWTANKTHENDRIPALGKQKLQAASCSWGEQSLNHRKLRAYLLLYKHPLQLLL